MPLPINCAAYGENPEGRPKCERGYYAPIFQWAIFYALIWGMIIAVTVIMLVVYSEVRKTDLAKVQKEEDTTKDTTTSSSSSSSKKKNKDGVHRMKRSRDFAIQGLWYLFPFYATWLFPVITEITEMVTNKYYDGMVVLVAFFVPFQGALNFCIYYLRPKYIKYREKKSRSKPRVSSLLSYTRSKKPAKKQQRDIFQSNEVMAISIASRQKDKALLKRLSSQEESGSYERSGVSHSSRCEATDMESGLAVSEESRRHEKKAYDFIEEVEEEKVEVEEELQHEKPKNRVSFHDDEDYTDYKKYVPYRRVRVSIVLLCFFKCSK